MVDAPYTLSTDECKNISIDPRLDYEPGTLIAAQAVAGTVWLFVSMFVY